MSDSRYIKAALIERIDFSDDLAVFRFEPEQPLEYTPGQYATLGLEDGSRKILRPYSVVSAPHQPFLEFFVELVPGGALSERLWEMKPSDTVWVRNRVVGRFTLQKDKDRQKHLMVATVTGVAPYISIMRAQKVALAEGRLEEPHRLLIVHGGSCSHELGLYREELENMEKEGWLTYVPTISRPWEDKEWSGEVGRVEDVVRKYADDHRYHQENAVAYACGHPQMIDKVKGILRRARFEKKFIKEEKYFVD